MGLSKAPHRDGRQELLLGVASCRGNSTEQIRLDGAGCHGVHGNAGLRKLESPSPRKASERSFTRGVSRSVGHAERGETRDIHDSAPPLRQECWQDCLDAVEGRVKIEPQQFVKDIQVDLAQRLRPSDPSVVNDAIERMTLC
jgi:hypothetical protein